MTSETGFKNPLVLVHGFLDTTWTPRWQTVNKYLEDIDPEAEIYQPDFAYEMPWLNREIEIWGTSVDSVKNQAKILEEVVEDIEDKPIDILAHSMGGLVSRYYIEEMEGEENVEDLITVGTPHKGTPTAYITYFTAGGQDLVPGSSFLKQLNNGYLSEDVNYTAVWSGSDIIVMPGWRSKIPEKELNSVENANNIYAGNYSHVELLTDKRAFNQYIDILKN